MYHQAKRTPWDIHIYIFLLIIDLQKCKYAYSSYCPGSSCFSTGVPWTSFQDIAEPLPGPVKWRARPYDGSRERVSISLGHCCWAPSSKAASFFLARGVSSSSIPLARVCMWWEVTSDQVSSRHPRDGWWRATQREPGPVFSRTLPGERSCNFPMKENWNWAPVSDAAVILGLATHSLTRMVTNITSVF